jgi:hypothetical protein
MDSHLVALAVSVVRPSLPWSLPSPGEAIPGLRRGQIVQEFRVVTRGAPAMREPPTWPPHRVSSRATRRERPRHCIESSGIRMLSRGEGVTEVCAPCRTAERSNVDPCPIPCPRDRFKGRDMLRHKEKTPPERGFLMEPTPGFEPGTPSLRVKCSGQLSYVGVSPMLVNRYRAVPASGAR